MPIRVTQCYSYPLKSAHGITMDKMQLTPRGPEHDRMWMLVHTEGPLAGRFISQRDKGCEKLALVQPEPLSNGIRFATVEGDVLEVAVENLRPYATPVRIWQDDCHALDAGDEAAAWFSNYLGLPSRLMRFADDFTRATNPHYAAPGEVGFADGFPILIANTASLAALSEHFADGINVPMERFRANVVLEGLEAFEEDVIHEIAIGDEVLLEVVKPCTRCKITTVDQDSGIIPSKEPLQSLAKTRRGAADGLQGVFFGQNAIPRKLGAISVGDEVTILSRRTMHPALEQAVLKYAA